MSILLKILIGLLLLAVLVVVVVFGAYLVAVICHERQWRKNLSDDYKMYSNARRPKNDG